MAPPRDVDNKTKEKDRDKRLTRYTTDNKQEKPIKNNVTCYNCNETGHTFYKCPKPLIKCTNCNWRGHLRENCPKLTQNKRNETTNMVLEVKSSVEETRDVFAKALGTKYNLPIKLNGQSVLSHLDLGSECTLIRLSDAIKLKIEWQITEGPILKGLGNVPYLPIGRAIVSIDAQGVIEDGVEILVVDDHLISYSILLGHSYTERPTVKIIKTGTDIVIKRDEQNRPSKILLKTLSDINLKQDGLTSVNVSAECLYNGPVYVHGSVRGGRGQEHFLLPGEYEIRNGQGKLLIQNLSKDNICIPANTLITRARGTEHLGSYSKALVLDISKEEEKEIICGDISKTEKQQLVDLLLKYKDCFSSSLKDLGFTTVNEMVIRLKDNEPVVYRPYRLALPDRQLVQKMVQEMLDTGIVSDSCSPYASPIVLVQKKTGEKRLCVDYRALNNKTIKEHFPLPRIEDQLDLLAGNEVFISLDLASGYYQIPIAEESRSKTAFVTPDGQYQYNRMPFGLVNAPSVFQRTINKILSQAKIKYALVYMDDVLIPACNFEQGMCRLEEVLNLLRGGGLTLKLTKCKFFLKKIEYLGFEISSSGVRPGTAKTEAVAKFPEPKNQHDVRRFIGLASFFRRFVKGFALIARPLTALLGQESPWTWGKEEQKAFDSLKNALTQRPLLALYQRDVETQLHTDASKLGVAGILLQRNGAGALQPVAYYSRQTTKDEQKLHSFELETLAVVASLLKFRVYLLGLRFTIFTDCNALRTTLTKRDLVPRIARWWIQFQEFDCAIEYRPGVRMSHVDALSRYPVVDENPKDHVLEALTVSSEDWITTVQDSDEEIKKIKDVLSNPKSENIVDIIKNYKLKNGRVYRIVGNDVLRWVVPKGARWQILKSNHDDVGHFGFDKTLDRIRSKYWFPKLRRFTKKYVNACLECAHHKVPGGPKMGELHFIPKVAIPFHTIHADHLGPFNKTKRGNTYILVIIDAFSKFVNLTAVRNTKSVTSVKVLKDHFSYFGLSNRLITDQGTSFTGKKFKDFIKTSGIKHIYIMR